jgi:hypothetical protein
VNHRDDSDRPALLTPTVVEAIAQRVADLLRNELGLGSPLLTPSEVAEQFAVSRAWVYQHAEELGAIRLGQGPKARLRFDARAVSTRLNRDRVDVPRASKPERPNEAHQSSARPLLPIYGASDGQ